MRALLDTNVVSELVARVPNPRVLTWLDSLDPADVYLSVVTISEIRKGIEKLPDSPRRAQLLAWLATELPARFGERVLTLDQGVMLTWGELVGRLEREGRPLPAIDSLVAALALHHHCTLVTRNVRGLRGHRRPDAEPVGVRLTPLGTAPAP